MRRLNVLRLLTATMTVVVVTAFALPASAQDVATGQDTGQVTGQDTQEAKQEPTKREPIYDESANASDEIAAALAKAKKDNKRVLIQYGGNWCGWCYLLHDVFNTDAGIKRTLLYEYEIVMLDVGHFDKNLDIVEKYDAKIKETGVPYLTVLNADGEVVVNQNTGDLEDGPKHDIAKVSEFLTAHKAAPLNAENVLTEGLAAAKASGKTAFVHLGAPWCGWCHRLEDFMAANQELFDKYFVDVKIDVDRMEGGKEVAARLRGAETGGIPWMVFLNGGGEALITSTGPQGNVGYPVSDTEIAHFVAMLEKIGVPEEERATFKQLLEKAGAEFRQ